MISQTLARSPEIVAVVRDAVAVMPQLVEEIETGQAAGIDAAGVMLRADALSGREATQLPAVAATGAASPLPAPAQVAATAISAGVAPAEVETPATPVQAAAEPATTAPGDEAGMDPVLREIFCKETAGHILVVRQFLERCAQSVAPYPVSEALYRACHTLSGIAKTAGARQGSKVAEPMEHYVRKLHDNGQGLPVEGLAILADTVRLLETVSEHVDETSGFFPEQGRLTEAWRKLEHTLDGELARLAAAAELTLADIWKPQAPYAGEKIGVRTATDQAPPVPHQPADDYTEPSVASVAEDAEEALPAGQDADDTPPHEALAEPWIVEPAAAPEAGPAAVEPVAEPFDVEYVFAPAAAAPAIEHFEIELPAAAVALQPESAQPEPTLPESAPPEFAESEAPQPELAQPEPPQPYLAVPELVAPSRDEAAHATPEAAPYVPLQVESAPEPAPEPEESDFDADIAAIFGEEATELLEQADAAFSRWRRDRADGAQVTELKRLLHTLKGGARMAGIRAMGDVSHELESYLAAIEGGTLRADAAALDVLQDSLDELHRMRELANCGQGLPPAREVVARIRDAAQRGSRLAAPAAPATPVAPAAADTPRTAGPIELPAAPAAPAIEVVPQETSEAEALAARTTAGFEPEPAALPPLEVHEVAAASASEQAPVAPSVPSEAPQAEPSGVQVGDRAEPPMQIAASDVDAARVESRPATAWQPPARRAEPAVGDAYAEAAPAAPPVLPGREAVGTAERQELARVDADLLDDLLNNAGEVSIFRARLEQQMTSIEFNLAELDRTVTRLREQLRKLEIETEAQILFKHQQDDRHRADFDPLELDRYSTIQQLSRALAESVSDVGSIEGLLENLNRDTQNLLLQQARIVTELQNGLMRTRMVPFQRHAQRLTRLVRQAAHGSRQEGRARHRGRVRRTRPAGARAHAAAVRAHAAQRRRARHRDAGRARRARQARDVARITMRLQREGAEVVIVVEDDGAGLDVAAIRDKARAMGLLRPEQDLTDEEALQLILEPGFSTADRLTQQAGRGVGMDVVATEVKKLGGGLFIESNAGPRRALHDPPAVHARDHAGADRARRRRAVRAAAGDGRGRRAHAARGDRAPSRRGDADVRVRRQRLTASSTSASFIGAAPSVLPETDVAAVGDPGARGRALDRARRGRAGRQPRDRREVGRAADRQHPRHLGRDDPRRRPHRGHPRHRRAGALGVARRARRKRAARDTGRAHLRAGRRRLDHGAARHAAPARAQRHARADGQGRGRGDGAAAGPRARRDPARHRDAAHGRLRGRVARAQRRARSPTCRSS